MAIEQQQIADPPDKELQAETLAMPYTFSADRTAFTLTTDFSKNVYEDVINERGVIEKQLTGQSIEPIVSPKIVLAEFTLFEDERQREKLLTYCESIGITPPQDAEDIPRFIAEASVNEELGIPISHIEADVYSFFFGSAEEYDSFITSSKPPENADQCVTITSESGKEQHWHGPWDGENKSKVLVPLALMGYKPAMATVQLLAQETGGKQYEELQGKSLAQYAPEEVVDAVANIIITRKNIFKREQDEIKALKESGVETSFESWNKRYEAVAQAVSAVAEAGVANADAELLKRMNLVAERLGFAKYDLNNIPTDESIILFNKQNQEQLQENIKNIRQEKSSIANGDLVKSLSLLHNVAMTDEQMTTLYSSIEQLSADAIEQFCRNLSNDEIVSILASSIEISSRPKQSGEPPTHLEQTIHSIAEFFNKRNLFFINHAQSTEKHGNAYHGVYSIRVDSNGNKVAEVDNCGSCTDHQDADLTNAVQKIVQHAGEIAAQNMPTITTHEPVQMQPGLVPAYMYPPVYLSPTNHTSHNHDNTVHAKITPSESDAKAYPKPLIPIQFEVISQKKVLKQVSNTSSNHENKYVNRHPEQPIKPVKKEVQKKNQKPSIVSPSLPKVTFSKSEISITKLVKEDTKKSILKPKRETVTNKTLSLTHNLNGSDSTPLGVSTIQNSINHPDAPKSIKKDEAQLNISSVKSISETPSKPQFIQKIKNEKYLYKTPKQQPLEIGSTLNQAIQTIERHEQVTETVQAQAKIAKPVEKQEEKRKVQKKETRLETKKQNTKTILEKKSEIQLETETQITQENEQIRESHFAAQKVLSKQKHKYINAKNARYISKNTDKLNLVNTEVTDNGDKGTHEVRQTKVKKTTSVAKSNKSIKSKSTVAKPSIKIQKSAKNTLALSMGVDGNKWDLSNPISAAMEFRRMVEEAKTYKQLAA